MKKTFSILLVLTLLLGIVPVIAMETSPAGPPTFDVKTVIVPDQLSVYQNQEVVFTATTTYTSNKSENQELHFVSDRWSGVDVTTEAVETQLEIDAKDAANPNEKQRAFVSTASLSFEGMEPGDYDVILRYEITLQHDNSGKRTYYTTAETAIITITVMEGQADEEAESQPEGTPLNHGQIVSAWAHWKQTKGNKNFRPGGPGVYRSLVWYKTQVEYGTFYTQQEVWDYLDSIYEPAPREMKQKNPNKGPGNNNGKGK
ncbi:MAG: hypothetical protein ACOYI6_01530 [Christensenellales bacterium]|jgi:hypothetical protein|nr:hypothetical protein [Clostridiales bacterium]